MSRITTINTRVQRALGDVSGSRWSAADLLAFLNEAIEDICLETNVLRDDIAFYLVQDIHTYTLPENTIEVLRTDFYGAKLALSTYQEIDEQGLSVRGDFSMYPNTLDWNNRPSDWQTQTTDEIISMAIFSKLKRRQLRVWPTPTGANFEVEGDLGNFHTPAGASDSGDFTEYPEIASPETKYMMVVKRSRLPTEITDIDAEFIQIDTICDKAIRLYMIAIAYENDIKEENRSLSGINYTKYEFELDKIKALVATDSMPTESFKTTYNGMG